MEYKCFELPECEKIYSNGFDERMTLNPDYENLRDFLSTKAKQLWSDGKLEYDFDCELGLALYNYLEIDMRWFDHASRYRADYGFWRYISLRVMPEIIIQRWKITPENRFEKKVIERIYKKGVRIYPYTLYWFIHLAWQGSIEDTKNVLSHGNSDWILQTVERPGKKGVNLGVMRELFKQCATNNIPVKKIMKNYTSMFVTFRPEVYPGGECAYVDRLIKISK